MLGFEEEGGGGGGGGGAVLLIRLGLEEAVECVLTILDAPALLAPKPGLLDELGFDGGRGAGPNGAIEGGGIGGAKEGVGPLADPLDHLL